MKKQEQYSLTTKANNSEQARAEAKITKAKHSTHISEAHECIMKKRSVYLSQTSMHGSKLLQRPDN